MKHAREDYQGIQDPSGKIGEDEPVFLIRAKDMTAVATLNFWASYAEAQGANPDIVETARNQALAMVAWQGKNLDKIGVPDL